MCKIFNQWTTCCRPKRADNAKGNEQNDKLHEIGGEISDAVKTAKEAYAQVDPKTKKSIAAGLLGLIALIAGVVGYKKHRDK